MPRPKMLKRDKRSEIVMVKLRREERKALNRESVERRKALKSGDKTMRGRWTASAIVREGFLQLIERKKQAAA